MYRGQQWPQCGRTLQELLQKFHQQYRFRMQDKSAVNYHYELSNCVKIRTLLNLRESAATPLQSGMFY